MNLSNLPFVAFNLKPGQFLTSRNCYPRVHRVQVKDLHFDGRTVRIITLNLFFKFQVGLRLLTSTLLEPLDNLFALKLVKRLSAVSVLNESNHFGFLPLHAIPGPVLELPRCNLPSRVVLHRLQVYKLLVGFSDHLMRDLILNKLFWTTRIHCCQLQLILGFLPQTRLNWELSPLDQFFVLNVTNGSVFQICLQQNEPESEVGQSRVLQNKPG